MDLALEHHRALVPGTRASLKEGRMDCRLNQLRAADRIERYLGEAAAFRGAAHAYQSPAALTRSGDGGGCHGGPVCRERAAR